MDFITNIPSVSTNILDLPYSGTNRSYATNFCTISTLIIQTNVGTQIHMIRVDTTWSWKGKIFTNSIQSYRSPN